MTGDNGMQPARATRLSLSVQAQRYLLGLIESGTYQPGEQLPSEKELAARLGISRTTLREALLNLAQEGVVIRKHGIGTFVAPGFGHRLESGLEHLESILELATRQKLAAQVGDLEVQPAAASDDLASKLQVLTGTVVTQIRRAVIVNRKPVAYLVDVIPTSILSPTDIGEAFNGSVLDLLRQKQDFQVGQALASIVAVNADRLLAQRLKLKPGQPLLLLEETLFDDKGRPVDFSRSYFVPDFFQFHVVRR